MYRKLLLASVGAMVLIGSAAFAADLPVYAPPAPIFTWTGIYIGGQIGYAWASGNNNFTGFDPFFPRPPAIVGAQPLLAAGGGTFLSSSAGGTPSGVIGGANVGYNYQINQWVLGIEGSVDGTSLSNTAVVAFPDGTSLTAHTKADIQGSIRGRLGIAWDRALIYGTGGVAFGGFNTDVSILNPAVPFFANGNVSNTRVGWTVGGGIQYAITNNWSVRAEYRYTNWGTLSDGRLAAVAAPGVFFNGNRHLNQNQVQVGFDYKFDLFSPGPGVARY
jgi:outer membrane immunogenic protein